MIDWLMQLPEDLSSNPDILQLVFASIQKALNSSQIARVATSFTPSARGTPYSSVASSASGQRKSFDMSESGSESEASRLFYRIRVSDVHFIYF